MKLDLENKLDSYDQIMDEQFNLLQDMINLSNDIIHQDYQDKEVLEKGVSLLESMVAVNKLNYNLVRDFPEKKEVKFIRDQYQEHKLDPLEKIREEVKSIQAHLIEVKEVSEGYERVDEELREEAMNTIQRIATYNLREYEDTLEDTFKQF